ncbi:hypothetical protein [Massilia putida]|nr:hypothetical protein [Massilia putida]
MKELTTGAVLFGVVMSCNAQNNEEMQRKIAEQARRSSVSNSASSCWSAN